MRSGGSVRGPIPSLDHDLQRGQAQAKERPIPDMIGGQLHQPSVEGLTAVWASLPDMGDRSGALYVAQCDLGRGIFVKRVIRRGEIILVFGGALIDFAETKRRGPRECMAIQVGPGQYIDTQPPGGFVNHSCAPNAGIRNDRDLAALRDIRVGEEIRYDYSTTMDEGSFTMGCRCGVPGCRQAVGDFSELPAGIQEYYLSQGLVMNFIVERLRGARGACAPW